MEITTIDEIFRQLCYCHEVNRTVETVSKLFKKQTNDANRVEIATRLLKEYNLLPQCKRYLREDGKSLTRSIALRNSGNKAFLKKDDRTALMLYTKSIAAAPFPSTPNISKKEIHTDLTENENNCTSEALALALANRSAVLFSMGDHEACLSDVRQALKYTYPNKLLYKLFERQGKCLQALGRIEEAVENLCDALKWLSSASGLTEEKKQLIGTELMNLVHHLKNDKPVKLSSCLQTEQPILLKCSYNSNHELLSASDCLELKYMPEMGRYLAATRDIQPGEVLAVEKPFASVLLPDYYWSHCYNCLKHRHSLLPCSQCSTVMYCSEECRATSWNNNHCIDCPLLDILQKLDVGKASVLSLKILIQVCKGQDLCRLIASLEEYNKCSDRTKGFSNDGTYSSSDYSPIYWLVGNTEKRAVGDLLSRAVEAACVLNCLETMTDFFSTDSNFPQCDITHHKLLFGGLLLRHMQNLPCNTHAVSEMVKTESENTKEVVPKWEFIKVGAAAYAVLSLLNHSCNPNVIRHNYHGHTAVLRTIRPIAKGEQVLDSYGPHYAVHKKTERRTILQMKYHFTCGCIACTEDWPGYYLLPYDNPTYLCTRCRNILPSPAVDLSRNNVICNNCNKSHNMTQIISDIEESSKEFAQNHALVIARKERHWEELAQKLVCHLQLLDRFIQQPWKEYCVCQEAIKECYVMTANCYPYKFNAVRSG